MESVYVHHLFCISNDKTTEIKLLNVSHVLTLSHPVLYTGMLVCCRLVNDERFLHMLGSACEMFV